MLRKDQPTTFGPLNDEETQSMNTLKGAPISPPIMAWPNSTGHISLDADVCTVQVGCVFLQQQQNGITKPIGYWSSSLTDAERKYKTTQQECLGIVLAVLLLRPYLQVLKKICKGGSLFTEVGPESHGKYRQTCALESTTLRIRV